MSQENVEVVVIDAAELPEARLRLEANATVRGASNDSHTRRAITILARGWV